MISFHLFRSLFRIPPFPRGSCGGAEVVRLVGKPLTDWAWSIAERSCSHSGWGVSWESGGRPCSLSFVGDPEHYERSYSHSSVGARRKDKVPADARLGALRARPFTLGLLVSGVHFPATTALVHARLVREARHALPGVLRPPRQLCKSVHCESSAL